MYEWGSMFNALNWGERVCHGAMVRCSAAWRLGYALALASVA
jgi:hypothetical protein